MQLKFITRKEQLDDRKTDKIYLSEMRRFGYLMKLRCRVNLCVKTEFLDFSDGMYLVIVGDGGQSGRNLDLYIEL